ncbi:MAG: C-terminal target protein [Bacteroidetes bacterium]|nr:C-terminal target protein [Bacteroidota bacterium]
MKKLLPAILLILSLKNYSQNFVLTQAAYEPAIGDTSRNYDLDTTAFTTGLMTNITGSNAVWNYQSLVTNTAIITSAYVSPSAVSSSTDYPGCTFVQKQGGLNNFFKSVTSPTTQTEFMGLYATGLSMNFTNTAIVAKYPMAFNTNIVDPFSGSFTFSTTSGNAAGTSTVTVDGIGTLNLPGGITLTNVLRVKSMQNINLTISGFPFASIKQKSYDFYHASQKYPILNINYTSTALTGQSSTVTASASGNKNYFTVVGIKENSLVDASISIYPNPSTEILYITSASSINPINIEIYSQLGQCIYRKGFESKIDVSSFASGIYFLVIKSEKGIARKKFIKE